MLHVEFAFFRTKGKRKERNWKESFIFLAFTSFTISTPRSKYSCPALEFRPLLSCSQEIIINRYCESRYNTSVRKRAGSRARALGVGTFRPGDYCRWYRVKGVFALTAFSTDGVTCCNRERECGRGASSKKRKGLVRAWVVRFIFK